MKSTIKLLKAYNVLNLMRGLVNRGIVLPRVIATTRKMCSDMRGGGRNKPRILAETVMKWKLHDAGSVVREQEEVNTRVWRESERILRDLQVSERFFTVWETEKAARKRELEEKRARKVAFLIEKSKEESREKRRSRGVELRSIDVSDKQLDETFESEPRRYGNVELSCEETAYLRLQPKFAVYEVPCVKDLEVDIEKGITNIRWSRMCEGDNSVFVENYFSDDEDNISNNSVSRSRARARRLDSNQ